MENNKNKLTKDSGEDKGVKYCGFYGGYDNNDSIYFENGELNATAYRYEIGGTGNVRLSKEETLEMYKAMKKFFEKDLIE